MEFLAYLVVTLLISYALRPKAQVPKPEAFEDIDFPRAEEGSPQCVIWGDCWIPDWTVTAVGNYRTIPIVQRGETTGYWYAFGCQMGLAKAIDELIEIQVGDKVLWRGSMTVNTTIVLNAPNLFGGFEREGGISGKFYLFLGGADQVMPADGELTATLVPPSPGFRGRATAFFDGNMCARSPYPKPWKFRVRRITSGWDGSVWYPETAAIEIVRPVSVGETQGTTGSTDEVATVRASTPVVIVRDVGSGDLRITLAGLVSLTVEQVWQWNGTTPLVNGLHYVLEVGNVIHFADVGENLGGGVNTINFEGVTGIVRYTHVQTTTYPPDSASLGTTRIRAMNPAHMLYECFTNRIWGRGYPASALNLSDSEGGLTYLANRLFNEGFGLCYRWNRKGGIKSVIQTIADTIGCNIYSDRTTGKISFKLMRGDYVKSDLPLFDASTGLISIVDMGTSTSEQAINEVVVTYRDPVTNNDRPVRIVNTASMQATGGIPNSQSIEMLAIPVGELASRVAKREMRGRTAALRKFEIELDRRGRSLVPGSLLRIVDLSRNIPDTVLRVGSVEYGPLGRGRIKVVAMKDVFGTPLSGFPTIPPLIGTPVGSGQPCYDDAVAFELPYVFVARALSPGDFLAMTADFSYLGAVMSQGLVANTAYDIAVKLGASDPGSETPPDESMLCFPPVIVPAPALRFFMSVNGSRQFYSDDFGSTWVDTAYTGPSGFWNRFNQPRLNGYIFLGDASGVSPRAVRRSTNGITWSAGTMPASIPTDNYYRFPTHNGTDNFAISLGDTLGPSYVIKSSDDGVNWTIAHTFTSFGVAQFIVFFKWLNDRFVIITTNGLWYDSPDGVTWTARSIPLLNGVYVPTAAVYFNGVWIIATNQDRFYVTTPDLTTFTQRSVSFAIGTLQLDQAATDGSVLISPAAGGLARTTNGTSWTRPLTVGDRMGVLHYEGTWLTGGTSVASTPFKIHRSIDAGVTWTELDGPVTTGGFTIMSPWQ